MMVLCKVWERGNPFLLLPISHVRFGDGRENLLSVGAFCLFRPRFHSHIVAHFIDVTALDWNGDDYTDFAVLYPGRQSNNSKKLYQYNLVLIDGKPDANGNLTCHHKDNWRWTLQTYWDGGLAQGRIAAEDMDGDGKDEIVIFVGNQKDSKLSLTVYDITKDLQLTATDEMTAYITYHNPSGYQKSGALDLAVGGFSGTGKLQIATLYSDFIGHYSISGSFVIDRHAVEAAVWEVKDGSLHKLVYLGEVGKLPQDSNTGYLRCETGDLDGDGMDELVWAGGDSKTADEKIALVVHDPIYDESTGKLTFPKKAYSYPLESNYRFPIFDLALSYFSEGSIPSDSDDPSKMGIALAARKGSQAVMRVVKWGGAGAFEQSAELSFPVTWNRATDYPVIAAGDLAQETLALGTPLHFVVSDQITPLMILQSPPRHRDIIDSVDYSCFCDEGYYGQMKYYSSGKKSATESSRASVSSAWKEKAGSPLLQVGNIANLR